MHCWLRNIDVGAAVDVCQYYWAHRFSSLKFSAAYRGSKRRRRRNRPGSTSPAAASNAAVFTPPALVLGDGTGTAASVELADTFRLGFALTSLETLAAGASAAGALAAGALAAGVSTDGALPTG